MGICYAKVAIMVTGQASQANSGGLLCKANVSFRRTERK